MNQPIEQHVAGTADTPTLSPLKRAFLALEAAQARVVALEQETREPIAIIGLGCRVPGRGNDAESFWALMRDGVDAISRVPADRWDIESTFDPNPEATGKIATREGGFIDGVDQFDPAFFGIAPREAQGMDPQQRVMLEVAWEALEHAGQAPSRLERSATGVYFGVCSSDYTYLQLKSGDPSLLDAHFTSGIAHSVFSGRLSYLLGLHGPSLTIDTACSSSLVAVHLAVQALRAKECRMALAGGVNLILAPDIFIALSHSRMLAPDGRCKTFDAAADGFARSEGCGIVVLKRLSDARADGDRVLAIILGSAVNQDGPSSGLTAPNGPAQEAVIRAALANAGVAPRQVGYIEAHGTGTQLGDPLEVHALGAVFGADRQGTAPLVIGSVKTNVGHLEGAAGVTGLIKLVLALRHRTIPAHLHFRTPSPHIHWGELPLQVPTKSMAWNPIEGRRIAGVSSFGFSGTNAHVVLEETPETAASSPASSARAYLFTLSARDERALAEMAGRYARAVRDRRDDELADICFTANHGRSHFARRAAIVARSISALESGLNALAQGTTAPHLRTASVIRRDPPRIAFLYTGQGSQYAGMARGLYETVPVFRAALDRCAAGLAPYLDRPLLEVLFTAEGQATLLDETAYTQPALFALEYALTELWAAWGVKPNVLIGHSVGEVVAACVAGVVELEDALHLVAQRGRLMQSLATGGAMAAISATEAEVAEAIAPHAARVSIAAINGPAQTVISGASSAIATLCSTFVTKGVRCQPLTVSHAFHSPLVDPILERFEDEVAGLRLSRPRLRIISNLSGRVAEPDELTQPAYWRRHVRDAVRFADGLRALQSLRPDLLIEIGPHPTLLSFAGAVFEGEDPQRIASLRKGKPDWDQMLEALASVYLAGAEIDWQVHAATHDGFVPRVTDLPTYAFQRERFWFRAQSSERSSGIRRGGHAVLGARLRVASPAVVHEAHIGAAAPAFVREHRVQDRVVLPAAAYLDALIACGRTVLRTDRISIEDVIVQEAMLLADDGALRAVQTVCERADSGAHAVTISSQPLEGDDDAWTTHVTAHMRAAPTDVASSEAADLAALQTRCRESIDPGAFYADFERRGLNFGPGFRSIRRLARGDGEALGEVALDDQLARDGAGYLFHPVLLDGCLQVMAAAMPADDADDVLHLPIGIGRYVVHRAPGIRCWSHVTMQAGGAETRRADVRVFDASGTILAEALHVQLKRVTRDALERLGDRWLDDCLYDIVWRDAPRDAQSDVLRWSPRLLTKTANAVVDQLVATAKLDAYEPFRLRVNELCADYVVDAFHRLGWRPEIGAEFTTDGLARQLGIAQNHRRLFGRLLAILAEVGIVTRDARKANVWRTAGTLPSVSPTSVLPSLHAACPEGAEAELELTSRVAAELAPALRGERDVMQLLFPGGSVDNAATMYRDSPTARFYNGLVAAVVAAATAAHGQGRTLRVLEVGGGTGGTTSHVLPRLAEAGVEYTFTDVGPLFVARARERFGSYASARCAVLDLERDPATQGFANQQFDVVIAANVVHATADLRATLARLHGLMAPDGLLTMLEVTAPQRWFDLTVGLTPGWWAFTDRDLRPDYPTLSPQQWMALLQNCGFNECVTLPATADARGALALQTLFVAQAGDAPTSSTRGWLLMADKQGVAEALAARLREQGERCVLVRRGSYALRTDSATIDPQSPGDVRRLFQELRSSRFGITDVVHAWALDAPVWDATTGDSLEDTKEMGAVSALRLSQALVEETPAPRLWILTRGAQATDPTERDLAPAAATLWGLRRTLQLEHLELRATCIDLDRSAPSNEIEALLAELAQSTREPEIALRNAGRRVPRLVSRRRVQSRVKSNPATTAAWRLVPAVPGSLDRFDRVALVRRVPGPSEVEIAVEATALNFKDVLNVLGMYPGDPGPLGGECAGRVSAIGGGVSHVRVGDPVMAVAGGSFASHVIARAELVRPRPANVSPEEGAAFSIAYLTAEFCLGHLAGLRPGQRVLIHAAAGGVGMAAVRLAQRAGAEVFATAGAPWKRELLRAMGIPHVLDSRNASFSDAIMSLTADQGVDVILNSLSGELIDSSFAVLSRGGCFIEIGKRDIKTHAEVEAMGRDLRYHVVDWGETAAKDPALIGRLYARLVEDLQRGALPPLPRHEFALDDAARAFRFMAQARHAGKIVVRHEERARWTPRRDGTYLVTGGLSGLGLRVARWLGERGAGRLVLIGRRGVTEEAAAELARLRQGGTDVVAEALDVADATALSALLVRVRTEGPPLRGVWHCAGVLDNAALIQQNETRYANVFAAKVRGARLLDSLTRGDPLECFVLFSSIASVLGAPGQSNHAAANAFLDGLAHERASRGLPALSINWGAWTEVGAAAGHDVTERLAAQGIGAFSADQGLRAMEHLIADRSVQGVAMVMDWRRYLPTTVQSTSLLSELATSAAKSTSDSTTQAISPGTIDLRAELAAAPDARRRGLLAAAVRERALRALGVDPAKPIDPRTPLGELGMDSLLAVELRNTLGTALGASLPATLLFDYPTIDALTDFLYGEVLGYAPPAKAATAEPDVPAATNLVGSIEELSDEEVDRMLAARARRSSESASNP
jgi:acyl transferase domain-containing protein/acyl carrier protein